MKHILIVVGSLLLVSSLQAQAATAGRFQFVAGEVKVVSAAGKERLARKGDEVNEGESIITSPAASAQVKMKDDGLIVVRADTRLRITTFAFNGKEDGSERSLISLVKGGFRAITGMIGHINKNNYKIESPTATIGIRGTDHEPTFIPTPAAGKIAIAEPGTYDKVNAGAALLSTARGMVVINPNQAGFVPNIPNAVPTVLATIPAFYRSAPSQDEPKVVPQSGANLKSDSGSASIPNSTNSTTTDPSSTTTTTASSGTTTQSGSTTTTTTSTQATPLTTIAPTTKSLSTIIAPSTLTAIQPTTTAPTSTLSNPIAPSSLKSIQPITTISPTTTLSTTVAPSTLTTIQPITTIAPTKTLSTTIQPIATTIQPITTVAPATTVPTTIAPSTLTAIQPITTISPSTTTTIQPIATTIQPITTIAPTTTTTIQPITTTIQPITKTIQPITTFSDRRLKQNIVRIGTHRLGIGIYEFDYIWGEHAIGVMADEVKQVMPEAVIRDSSGYDMVDYSKLK